LVRYGLGAMAAWDLGGLDTSDRRCSLLFHHMGTTVFTCRRWSTSYKVASKNGGSNGSCGGAGSLALWQKERLGSTWFVATEQLVETLVHFLEGLVVGLLVLPVLLPLLLGWRCSVKMGLVVRGNFLLLFLDGAFTDTVGLERNYHGEMEKRQLDDTKNWRLSRCFRGKFLLQPVICERRMNAKH
jgi:hypothetical protein